MTVLGYTEMTSNNLWTGSLFYTHMYVVHVWVQCTITSMTSHVHWLLCVLRLKMPSAVGRCGISTSRSFKQAFAATQWTRSWVYDVILTRTHCSQQQRLMRLWQILWSDFFPVYFRTGFGCASAGASSLWCRVSCWTWNWRDTTAAWSTSTTTSTCEFLLNSYKQITNAAINLWSKSDAYRNSNIITFRTFYDCYIFLVLKSLL